MNEKIILMTKKLGSDPELVKQIAEVKDIEKAYELLDGEGAGVTLEEFKDAIYKFRESSELSDDDLDKVAAGFDGVTLDDVFFTLTIWAAAM